MKRILKFGGALLALGMLLASCNMITADSTVSGNSTEQESSNINSITIGVNSIVSTERTILPVDWTDARAGNLTYVLSKKATGTSEEYVDVKSFSYTELKEKTATVNIELKHWDLRLVGYISVTGSTENFGPNYDSNKPTLVGLLEDQDFTTGIKAITFDLKPIEITPTTTDATGSINVEIAWLTTKPKRLELGVYDIEKSTKDILADTGRVDAKVSPDESVPEDKFTGTDETLVRTYTWIKNDCLKAGIYKFAAVFYDSKETDDGKVIGYYIDYLYVDGGNLSQATINYGDKFNTTPENPTWLAVETYFKPIEGDETTTTNDYQHYFAKFHWNDNSTNETGFELVIKEGTNAEIPLNSETFASSAFYTTEWYDGTDIRELTNTNTLDAGKTWVVLKLETGKLYTAKIRATNDFTPAFAAATNPNDFCKNLNRNGDGQGRSYAPIVGDDKQFGMFVVNYALDGGQVTYKNTSTSSTTVKNYIMGYNYHSEQQDLMSHNQLVEPYITKQGYVFDHWETTDTSPTPVYVIKKEQYENMVLNPVWSGADVRVGVTFPSYADAVDVRIADKMNTDNTVIFDPKKEPSISVKAGESLTVTNDSFVLTDAKGNVIANSSANGISIASGEWTWEPDPASLPPAGYYCLQITGTYNDKAGSGRENMTLCGNVYINLVN